MLANQETNTVVKDDETIEIIAQMMGFNTNRMLNVTGNDSSMVMLGREKPAAGNREIPMLSNIRMDLDAGESRVQIKPVDHFDPKCASEKAPGA